MVATPASNDGSRNHSGESGPPACSATRATKDSGGVISASVLHGREHAAEVVGGHDPVGGQLVGEARSCCRRSRRTPQRQKPRQWRATPCDGMLPSGEPIALNLERSSGSGQRRTAPRAGGPAPGGDRGARLEKAFRVPEHRMDTLKERAPHPFTRVEYRELHALRDGSRSTSTRASSSASSGQNGSGKSTLLKILASIYRADCRHGSGWRGGWRRSSSSAWASTRS